MHPIIFYWPYYLLLFNYHLSNHPMLLLFSSPDHQPLLYHYLYQPDFLPFASFISKIIIKVTSILSNIFCLSRSATSDKVIVGLLAFYCQTWATNSVFFCWRDWGGGTRSCWIYSGFLISQYLILGMGFCSSSSCFAFVYGSFSICSLYWRIIISSSMFLIWVTASYILSLIKSLAISRWSLYSLALMLFV